MRLFYEGLECRIGDADPWCSDYDECTDPRYYATTLAYCGAHSYCENTVGSFQCVCLVGYTSHTPYTGCVDIDECEDDTAGEYCGDHTVCHNTEGWDNMPHSYNCSCSQGYELFQQYRGMI